MTKAQRIIELCEVVKMKNRLNAAIVSELQAKKYHIFDELTADYSGFKTFQELLDAKGDYRPTITLRGESAPRRADKEFLAQLYDKAQELRGDERRARVTE